MKDLPILFAGPLVRALLAGRKSQTRRLSKAWLRVKKGQTLWVRERTRVASFGPGARSVKVVYEADLRESDWIPYPGRLARPVVGRCLAYGGPRETSRIDLEATEDAREERLLDITEEDAKAEGVEPWDGYDAHPGLKDFNLGPYYFGFAKAWGEINGDASWKSNPLVVVLSFKVIRPVVVTP